jgi:hypothetical protein
MCMQARPISSITVDVTCQMKYKLRIRNPDDRLVYK